MILRAIHVSLLTMVCWLPSGGVFAELMPAMTEMPLPSGVKPFNGAIDLHYGGFEKFSLTWRADILTIPRATIAEGWVMAGSMHARGDDLAWSYRLSNIGRDEIEREAARLEVTTDAWGQVRKVRVMSKQWPQRRGDTKALSDWLFDEQDLRFLLCCCPREALRMGDIVSIPPTGETMPHLSDSPGNQDLPAGIEVLNRNGQASVAGVLDTDHGQSLVIRHTAQMTGNTPDGVIEVRRTGYSLIDTRTCLPVRTVWANSVSMPAKPDMKPFSILYRIETRF